MLESGKAFLNLYSIVVIAILVLKTFKLVGTKKDLDGSITVAAVIPILIYLINIQVNAMKAKCCKCRAREAKDREKAKELRKGRVSNVLLRNRRRVHA